MSEYGGPVSEFTCGECGETFEMGWTDDEAKAEATANGFDLDADNVIVCDPCYEAIMAYAIETGLHEPR